MKKTLDNYILNCIFEKNYGKNVYILSSNYNIIADNELLACNLGISVVGSDYNKIINNNLVGSSTNIYLSDSEHNLIQRNKISYSTIAGITLYGDSNMIRENSIHNNNKGIYTYYTNSNLIFLNDIMHNIVNIDSSNSHNYWNSPELMVYFYNNTKYTNYLGNYWDEYNGVDSDGDGIGDVPYTIDANNSDNYPLMVCSENYITSESSTIKGDINGDNSIDVADVMMVAHMVIGKLYPDLKADFSRNGRIDVGDLARIAYYVLGKISER